MKQHLEARFEDAIIDHLAKAGGYVFVDYVNQVLADGADKARTLAHGVLKRARRNCGLE